jgi:acetyl esterase/lipase
MFSSTSIINTMPERRTMIRVLTSLACLFALGIASVTFAQSGKPSTELPATVQFYPDVVYANYGERALHLDLFVPKSGPAMKPAVVVVHGGGWLNGDKTKFRALSIALATRGYVTAAIEYRLGGEAKFPAAIHDCNAAVRWLRAHADEHGIDSNRIGAVGGSAGGHLVGLMATSNAVASLQGNGGNADQSSQLQAAVVMAGPLELATGPVADRSRKEPELSNSNKWLGKTVDEAPELYRLASATTHISESTPPILFMTGEHDKPARNLEARRRLRKLGIQVELRVYKDGKHGCWNRLPWFAPIVDDIDAFLATTLKKQTSSATSTLVKTDWGTIRYNANGLELLVDRVPASGNLEIPRLNNPVGKIYLKGDATKKELKLKPGLTIWAITLPKAASNDGKFVIVVETIGAPHLPRIPRIVAASREGSITLAAHDSITHGKLLRYEPQPHKNTVGYWANAKDTCEWHFYTDEAASFDLHILQGCGKGQGSKVEISVGDQTIEFTVEDTGHFQNFKDRQLGTITLDKAGLHTLRIRPIAKAKNAVMDVRQVRLVRRVPSER